MKTLYVKIGDRIHRDIKVRAVQEGRTLSQLVEEALTLLVRSTESTDEDHGGVCHE